MQYLFDNRDAVVEAWATVSAIGGFAKVFKAVGDRRRRAIAKQWDQQGFTAPRLRRVLASRSDWDLERLAQYTSLTVGEATAVLINAGYTVGSDGLFQLSGDSASQDRQSEFDDIGRRAAQRGPNRRREWPEDDLEGDEEPDTSD